MEKIKNITKTAKCLVNDENENEMENIEKECDEIIKKKKESQKIKIEIEGAEPGTIQYNTLNLFNQFKDNNFCESFLHYYNRFKKNLINQGPREAREAFR